MLGLLASPARAATSFVASVTGNFNDGATYGLTSPGVEGTDFPTTGDHVTILAGITVTLPDGYSIVAGSITLNSGTLAGTPTTLSLSSANLTMGGKLTMGLASSGFAKVRILRGGVLNLNNNILQTNANGISGNYLHFWGTATDPATITGGGGGHIRTSGGGFDQVDSSYTYARFIDMGSMQSGGYGTTNFNFRATSTTWERCGTILTPFVRATPQTDKYIEFSNIVNSTSATPLTWSANNNGVPTGRNGVYYTVISTVPSSTISGGGATFQINATSVTATGLFMENTQFTMATSNGIGARISSTTMMFSSTITAANPGGVLLGSTTVAGFYIYTEADNSHFWQPSSSQAIAYGVMEINVQGPITDDADGIIYSASAIFSSVAVSNILSIGRRGGNEFLSMQGNANLNEYGSMTHVTVWFDTTTSTNDSCFRVGETYAGKSNMYPYLANNLCVASSSSTNAHIVRDQNAGSADQKISTANCNGNWNIAGLKYQTTRTVGTYGDNDVQADPGFVDTTRGMLTFDTSLGGAGTLASVGGAFRKMNGYGGSYNPAYTYADLMTYVNAGFVSTNAAFKGTACDGGDMGFSAVVPAASIRQRPIRQRGYKLR